MYISDTTLMGALLGLGFTSTWGAYMYYKHAYLTADKRGKSTLHKIKIIILCIAHLAFGAWTSISGIMLIPKVFTVSNR